MWASSIAFSRGNVASTSHRCGPIGSAVRRDPAVRVVPGARRHRRRRRRPASSDRDDTLSALDRLVPGLSADEAARTPPPAADDEDDQPTVFGDGRVVREVVVELEPPDNIAVAKIRVESASTRCVQMTVQPPLGISFEENTETGEIFVAEIAQGSNADAAGVAKVGDVLRAASAMVPEMKYGQGNLLLGGNGRPGFRRVLYVVPNGEDYRPGASFDQTIGAVVSNSRAGNFDVTLVLERRLREE